MTARLWLDRASDSGHRARQTGARAVAWAVVTAAVLFPTPQPGSAQSSLVPVQHPVYEWLHRQRILGNTPTYRLEMRPLSRGQVRAHLARIDSLGAADPAALADFDRSHLETYLREFSPVGSDAGARATVLPAGDAVSGGDGLGARARAWVRGYREPHLYAFADSTRSFVLDAWGSWGRVSGSEADGTFATLRDEKGLRAYADFLGHFGMHLEAGNLAGHGSDAAVRYDPRYNKTFEAVVQGKSNSTYVEASASARWGPLAFSIGHGGMQVGPGRRTSLMLSRDASTFDWLRLDADFGKFRYTAVHGSLASDVEFGQIVFPDDTVRTNYAGARWLAIHRFDVQPIEQLRLGFTEMLTYSARPTDYAYLNPVAPLFFSELDSGDRDNAVWVFDATVRPVDRVELYGTLFIDDLVTFGDIFNSGPEVDVDRAFDLGVDAALPYGLEAGLRYVRIEPWVYTHWQRLNTLDQRGFPLGHPLGPNATSREAHVRAWLPLRGYVGLSVAQSKKGLNPLDADGNVRVNVGGDLEMGALTSEQGNYGLFESADLQEFRTLGFEAGFEPIRGVRVGVEYGRRTQTAGTRMPDFDFLGVRLRYGM